MFASDAFSPFGGDTERSTTPVKLPSPVIVIVEWPIAVTLKFVWSVLPAIVRSGIGIIRVMVRVFWVGPLVPVKLSEYVPGGAFAPTISVTELGGMKKALDGSVLLTHAMLGETDAVTFDSVGGMLTVMATFPLKPLMVVTLMPNGGVSVRLR